MKHLAYALVLTASLLSPTATTAAETSSAWKLPSRSAPAALQERRTYPVLPVLGMVATAGLLTLAWYQRRQAQQLEEPTKPIAAQPPASNLAASQAVPQDPFEMLMADISPYINKAFRLQLPFFQLLMTYNTATTVLSWVRWGGEILFNAVTSVSGFVGQGVLQLWTRLTG